ncbi:Protein CBG27716 [Caenorhabditis briggsae]|uniref:Protein CBG27716 n=1 Tax=Caenorhabditis briggsae TaxID=6238 RepID=B6IJ14_CAEBR|nr:Protein CBG27716 [Caenorhabditis briggsae]CAR99994.1 Protein CBG27716 [Caenorhabditis briggsae]
MEKINEANGSVK